MTIMDTFEHLEEFLRLRKVRVNKIVLDGDHWIVDLTSNNVTAAGVSKTSLVAALNDAIECLDDFVD